jgi:hypothetical protein
MTYAWIHWPIPIIYSSRQPAIGSSRTLHRRISPTPPFNSVESSTMSNVMSSAIVVIHEELIHIRHLPRRHRATAPYRAWVALWHSITGARTVASMTTSAITRGKQQHTTAGGGSMDCWRWVGGGRGQARGRWQELSPEEKFLSTRLRCTFYQEPWLQYVGEQKKAKAVKSWCRMNDNWMAYSFHVSSYN